MAIETPQAPTTRTDQRIVGMRCRNCGVSTRRWDKLVVNLSDIWVRAEIITDQCQLWQMLPTKQRKQHKVSTKI